MVFLPRVMWGSKALCVIQCIPKKRVCLLSFSAFTLLGVHHRGVYCTQLNSLGARPVPKVNGLRGLGFMVHVTRQYLLRFIRAPE